MPRSWIERIREKVRLRQYDMTVHALEEMAEDRLDIVDMEHAVLAGRVVRTERDDPRGNKHVIEGMAADGVTPGRRSRPLYWGRPISDYHRYAIT